MLDNSNVRQVCRTLVVNVIQRRSITSVEHTSSINESRVNNQKAIEKAGCTHTGADRSRVVQENGRRVREENLVPLLGEMWSGTGIGTRTETGTGTGTSTSTGMGLGTGARGCVAVAQSAHEDTLSRAALALGCGGASQFNRFDIRLELS